MNSSNFTSVPLWGSCVRWFISWPKTPPCLITYCRSLPGRWRLELQAKGLQFRICNLELKKSAFYSSWCPILICCWSKLNFLHQFENSGAASHAQDTDSLANNGCNRWWLIWKKMYFPTLPVSIDKSPKHRSVCPLDGIQHVHLQNIASIHNKQRGNKYLYAIDRFQTRLAGFLLRHCIGEWQNKAVSLK